MREIEIHVTFPGGLAWPVMNMLERDPGTGDTTIIAESVELPFRGARLADFMHRLFTLAVLAGPLSAHDYIVTSTGDGPAGRRRR